MRDWCAIGGGCLRCSLCIKVGSRGLIFSILMGGGPFLSCPLLGGRKKKEMGGGEKKNNKKKKRGRDVFLPLRRLAELSQPAGPKKNTEDFALEKEKDLTLRRGGRYAGAYGCVRFFWRLY